MIYEFEVLNDDRESTGEKVGIDLPMSEAPEIGAMFEYEGRVIRRVLSVPCTPNMGPTFPLRSFQIDGKKHGLPTDDMGHAVFNSPQEAREHCAATGMTNDWIPGCGEYDPCG